MRNKIRIIKLISVVFFLIGWGITIHAVASELYHKGGYTEILKPQGEYVGLTLMMIAFLIILWLMYLNRLGKIG